MACGFLCSGVQPCGEKVMGRSKEKQSISKHFNMDQATQVIMMNERERERESVSCYWILLISDRLRWRQIYLQDWDFLLNQVWLFLDDWDDLVDGLGDWDWDVLDDWNNVWLGNPNWYWYWVWFGYWDWFWNVNDVRLWDLMKGEREGQVWEGETMRHEPIEKERWQESHQQVTKRGERREEVWEKLAVIKRSKKDREGREGERKERWGEWLRQI